ncbi:LLM class flavin-dependent oxidoreductase [Nocardioides convexus]|uniref:LLM class flavin-dependent oxidoreductase n=1 Tax=Nocardioides convexus TaxID=2712224 RepID=UPI0024184C91|nr:LLM class flavin-dependent oxidoreductase [Nocardioides convexus]
MDAESAVVDPLRGRHAAAVDRPRGRGRGAWAPTGRTSGCTTSPARLASPFPLLAAVGARTSRIEIGTGVIDMRYENPLYFAEDAGSADLISGGRLQARHLPRVTGAGHRRLAVLRLRARRGRDRGRHGPASHRGAARGAQGRGLRPAEPAPDVRQPAGPAAHRAALGGPARPVVVGRCLQRHRPLGCRARDEPDETRPSRRTRAASPSTSSRPSRSASSGKPGPRPATTTRPGSR